MSASAVRIVAVIDPATNTPETDCFESLPALPLLNYTYHLPALFGMKTLKALQEIHGILIFGSNASVVDQSSWQNSLCKWLELQIARDVPILGLCFGHQLLAAMYGAKIRHLHVDKRQENTVRTVRINENRLWMEGNYDLIVSHREIVNEVLPPLEIIGNSPLVNCEALQHPFKPIWGLQAHPEARHGFLKNQNILIDQNDKNCFDQGQSLIRAFLRFVAELPSDCPQNTHSANDNSFFHRETILKIK